MTKPTFDQDYWQQLWSKTLLEHADKVARRPPSAQLMAEVAQLEPGRALDAGCGHGADTLWLALQGWHVSAVDFSAAALAHGRSMAEAAGSELARRIDWIEADLATWTAEPGRYDLVVCLYVHVAGSVEAFLERMANGVAPGGTLLLVGHRPIDPSTGAATAAANQVQVSVEAAVAALDPRVWELVVAEERPRAVAGTGVDAVIRARRRTSGVLGHISFGVRDLDRSQAFYDAALAPLGWVRRSRTEHGIAYGPAEPRARGEIALFLKTEAGAQLAAGPGFHLGLIAPSRTAVDAFHAGALANGGRSDGPPGLRPHYGATYYAAFVFDPDGHKLEAKIE